MKKQFLLVNSSLPVRYTGCQTFWCVYSTSLTQDSSDTVTISLPSDNMPVLSQALFAIDMLEPQLPLVVSTLPLDEPTFNRIVRSRKIVAFLPEQNTGYMSFPTAEHFINLAKAAIRTHNPAKGSVTLEDVRCQVLLNADQN